MCDEIIKGLKGEELKTKFTSRYGCVEQHFRISPKIYGKQMCNDLYGQPTEVGYLAKLKCINNDFLPYLNSEEDRTQFKQS